MMFITVVLLAAAWGAQMFSLSFWAEWKRWVWWGSPAIVFAAAAAGAWAQYHAWAEDAAGKFLLPPYNGISYFALYVTHRIFAPWIASFLAGALGGSAAFLLNRRYGERFFEAEEPWMFATGIFLSGFPGFLLYAALISSGGIALTFVYAMFRKGRASLYWLWLPLSIFAILITNRYVPREILARFSL